MFTRVAGISLAMAGALVLGALGSLASAAPGERTVPLRATPSATSDRVIKPAKLQPPIVRKLIPFGHRRKMQMARYSKRHYGHRAFRLHNPRVIVEHYTDGPTMMSAWWTMANNTKNLGESPGVCTHFIVDGNGKIYRTVPLQLRCRHTIGLNQTAIGIEHVGTSDHQVMSRQPQRQASYQLTLWLMAKYNIPVKNVIGHGESLLSPYRYERYKSWKCLTHTDFSHHTMHRYRKELRRRAKAHGVRVGPRPTWVDIGC